LFSIPIEEIQFANEIGHKPRILKKTVIMKNLKLITGLLVLHFVFWRQLDVDLDALVAPQNISALTTVTQDNTGKVTSRWRSNSIWNTFGDGTTAPAYVGLGGTVEHTYKEGVYNAKIIERLLMVKNRSNS
jgi:hypothetical protein